MRPDDAVRIELPRSEGGQGPPWASLTLALVFIGVFFSPGTTAGSLVEMVHHGWDFPPFVFQAREWWRLGSSAFLHYDGFRLAVSLLFLATTGVALERAVGSLRFLALFSVCLILARLLTWPWQHGLSLGAADPLLGLAGAATVLVGPALPSLILLGSSLYLGLTTSFLDPWAGLVSLAVGVALARRTAPGWVLTVLAIVPFLGAAYGVTCIPGFKLEAYPTRSFHGDHYALDLPVYFRIDGDSWIGPGVNGTMKVAPVTRYRPMLLSEIALHELAGVDSKASAGRFENHGNRPWYRADILHKEAAYRGQRALTLAGEKIYSLSLYGEEKELDKLMPRLLKSFRPEGDPELLLAQLHLERGLELVAQDRQQEASRNSTFRSTAGRWRTPTGSEPGPASSRTPRPPWKTWARPSSFVRTFPSTTRTGRCSTPTSKSRNWP